MVCGVHACCCSYLPWLHKDFRTKLLTRIEWHDVVRCLTCREDDRQQEELADADVIMEQPKTEMAVALKCS